MEQIKCDNCFSRCIFKCNEDCLFLSDTHDIFIKFERLHKTKFNLAFERFLTVTNIRGRNYNVVKSVYYGANIEFVCNTYGLTSHQVISILNTTFREFRKYYNDSLIKQRDDYLGNYNLQHTTLNRLFSRGFKTREDVMNYLNSGRKLSSLERVGTKTEKEILNCLGLYGTVLKENNSYSNNLLDYDLSSKTINALNRYNIYTRQDVINFLSVDTNKLTDITRIGEQTADEIITKLGLIKLL